MIEINSTYPEVEDLTLAANRCLSQAREAVSDLEQLVKRVLEGRFYITDEECAEILRCKVSEIPARLTKYRPVAKRGYVYKVSDVFEFIESKRIGGK
jgi:hypothetical protein